MTTLNTLVLEAVLVPESDTDGTLVKAVESFRVVHTAPDTKSAREWLDNSAPAGTFTLVREIEVGTQVEAEQTMVRKVSKGVRRTKPQGSGKKLAASEGRPATKGGKK